MSLILSKCPCNALQAIDVSRCNCVSSSGLISVISGHDGLEQLGAGYCLSVSLYLIFLVYICDCLLYFIVISMIYTNTSGIFHRSFQHLLLTASRI